MRRDMFMPRASMGFRPLPPQWLQDIGRSHAGPHTRFGKRRGGRFSPSPADRCNWLWWDLLLLLMIVRSGRSDCQRGIVGFVARKQGPGDPCILVRKRDGRDIGKVSVATPIRRSKGGQFVT